MVSLCVALIFGVFWRVATHCIAKMLNESTKLLGHCVLHVCLTLKGKYLNFHFARVCVMVDFYLFIILLHFHMN